MVKKVKPLVSRAQAKRLHEEVLSGKVPFQVLRDALQATGDVRALPDRITPKKLDPKTELAIKGMI